MAGASEGDNKVPSVGQVAGAVSAGQVAPQRAQRTNGGAAEAGSMRTLEKSDTEACTFARQSFKRKGGSATWWQIVVLSR